MSKHTHTHTDGAGRQGVEKSHALDGSGIPRVGEVEFLGGDEDLRGDAEPLTAALSSARRADISCISR